MDSRPFKIAAIRAQVEFHEAEHRRLLEMVTSYQVDLAWISERMDCIQRELRLLHRDLKSQENLTSNDELRETPWGATIAL